MSSTKKHKYSSKASSLAYASLNILLALAVFGTIYVTNSPIFALLLVALGKWRILSVRPRFWAANVLSNLVDIIVGVSFALLIWLSGGYMILQLGLTVLHIVWLLFIKQRSKYTYAVIQAGTALFLGLVTLSLIAYSWDSFYFVAVVWVITYASARHVASRYEGISTNLYAIAAATVCAELGWISYYWMIAYTIPGLAAIKVSQFSIFAVLMGFVAERTARSYHKHGEVRFADIAMPILLTAMTMVVAYIFAVLSGSDAL